MFESDDFDQVLSQFEFPETDKVNFEHQKVEPAINSDADHVVVSTANETEENVNRSMIPDSPKKSCFVSPKHMKRKIISSHFNHQSKRKFPGPAGLLNGVLEETKDNICQFELLSQDINFTQNNLQSDIFETPIWKRLLSDTKEWQIKEINSIKTVKHQALAGNLRRRKAQFVTAFVEAIDRSGTDPLIILRDDTGTIKCTLHRDAWTKFSSYIVSDYCAFVLQKPTVLTTGSAFKKHYLNITLSNILAIYSSVVLNEDKIVPDGYKIVYEDDFTVIKTDIECSENRESNFELSNGDEDIFDCLDSIFSDEVF